MVSLTFGAPLPALLNFEAEHQKMQALATENHHLHNQLASTRQALAEAESNVQKLDARLAQQIAHQTATKRRCVRSLAWPDPIPHRGKGSGIWP